MAKITVIIVTCNCEKYIYQCLNSLSDQTNTNFDVVVVDNNSIDYTLDIVKDFNLNLTIIRNNLDVGVGSAVNQGILEKSADVYVLLDSRSVVQENFIEQGLIALKKYDIASPKIKYINSNRIYYAGSKVRLNQKNFLKYSFLQMILPRGFGKFDMGQYDLDREVEFASSQAMFFKNQVRKIIGVLNKKLSLDWSVKDYSLRAKRTGLTVGYFPSIIVYYKLPSLIKLSYADTMRSTFLFFLEYFGTSFLMLWLLKSPVEVIANPVYFLRQK